MNHTLIEALQWRYATKKFDADRKISEEDMTTLLQSIQLTPSSYGLQPLKILVIENKDLREQIKPIAWDQSQIVDASHLLVFCHYTQIHDDYVNQHIELISNTRQIPKDKLEGFGNHVKNSVGNMPLDKMAEWTAKQTYIALGQLLLSCALLKVDATPMEGFDKEALNQFLNLSDQGLSASLLCPLGFRHPNDPYLQLKKVRRSKESLIEYR